MLFMHVQYLTAFSDHDDGQHKMIKPDNEGEEDVKNPIKL